MASFAALQYCQLPYCCPDDLCLNSGKNKKKRHRIPRLELFNCPLSPLSCYLSCHLSRYLSCYVMLRCRPMVAITVDRASLWTMTKMWASAALEAPPTERAGGGDQLGRARSVIYPAAERPLGVFIVSDVPANNPYGTPASSACVCGFFLVIVMWYLADLVGKSPNEWEQPRHPLCLCVWLSV